jgi:hypothetical protein
MAHTYNDGLIFYHGISALVVESIVLDQGHQGTVRTEAAVTNCYFEALAENLRG